MPGIESRDPERTDTSSGFFGSPNFLPVSFSSQAMAFVNAVAWISHREDHHPDITVGYNQCRVEYMTHAIKGLSENDFICAAKLDKLFEL